MQQTEQAIKIGLSLSGGGARGAAHIGVIRALLEADIMPTHVSGTSAGAIVGSLYAAGLSPDAMLDFVKQSSVLKLIRVGMPIAGLTNLNYLKERMAAVVPIDSFEELNHALYVAITNLNSGRLEIRSSGPLFEVIAASCTIPMVFKPVEMDGSLYVDGGVIDNLPVEPLLDITDFRIGVNLVPQTPVDNKSMQSLIGIMLRCFDLSVVAHTRTMIQHLDALIEPQDICQYHIFQFRNYQQIHDLGYRATQAILPELQQKLQQRMAQLASPPLSIEEP